MAMKRWLAIAVVLGALFLIGSSPVRAAKMEITGVIIDWKKGKNMIPASAYLQLVKIEEEMKGTTDAQGLSAFDSEFPKISVRADGSFSADVKDLPEGKYFIALQRAMPREMSGNSMATAIPILITGDKEPLIIEVPGTFPLDVGRVDVGVRVQETPGVKEKK
jgi:hypothetical protein